MELYQLIVNQAANALDEDVGSGDISAALIDASASLDTEFDALYTKEGRPSIAPERLIRASLLQILFSIRSERQLMEQMDYNLLFRWFFGLGIDDPVWGEGRLGIDPVDQFSPERAKPRAVGRRCSPRTATGC